MSRHPDFKTLERELRNKSPIGRSLLLLAVLSCLIAAITWAHHAELDDVTRVDGRVVPSADVQVIETAEPGVLQVLHVREGQVVEKGALLMELDATQLDSNLSQEQQRAFGLRARIQRLQAEIESRDLDFDPELLGNAAEVVRSETALFEGRRKELDIEIAILERQRQQRKREHEEVKADLVSATATLTVLAEEHAIMAPLVQSHMEPATTLMALRRSAVEWNGRKARAEAVLNRLQSSLDEIDERIRATRSRFQSAALNDLALATAELAALKPALPALQNRASRARLRSPVRGIVNRVHRSTLGGMARSGEELIEIVPLDDTLLVEAYVRPEKIAFLHAGQPVKIKITAYDFARYGSLDGEIIRIGADTISRSDRNDEEVFVIEIKTKNTILDANGIGVEIIPGMIAEVDILNGRRTVLEYLIQPIVKVKDRALRE